MAQWRGSKRREGSAALVLGSIIVAASLVTCFQQSGSSRHKNKISWLVLLMLGTLHKYANRSANSNSFINGEAGLPTSIHSS